MSKVRKAKKLRQPNVPLATGPAPALDRVDSAASARPAAETTQEFDYSVTRKELSRIGVIAGSFIAVLVVLSFIIR